MLYPIGAPACLRAVSGHAIESQDLRSIEDELFRWLSCPITGGLAMTESQRPTGLLRHIGRAAATDGHVAWAPALLAIRLDHT